MKFVVKGEAVKPSRVCTNENQCCDEERCYCQEVKTGARVLFVGNTVQLQALIA